MRIKGITDEDFVNYKLPSMYICTCFCDFKCDKESGVSCCQNSSLAKQCTLCIPDNDIIQRYLKNPITKAIVFAGLEPFEQFDEMFNLISKLRNEYHCSDTVVIYTGYELDEIKEKIDALRMFQNIVVKFGRFLMDEDSHYDDVLGIFLASPNQHAEVIS